MSTFSRVAQSMQANSVQGEPLPNFTTSTPEPIRYNSQVSLALAGPKRRVSENVEDRRNQFEVLHEPAFTNQYAYASKTSYEANKNLEHALGDKIIKRAKHASPLTQWAGGPFSGEKLPVHLTRRRYGTPRFTEAQMIEHQRLQDKLGKVRKPGNVMEKKTDR